MFSSSLFVYLKIRIVLTIGPCDLSKKVYDWVELRGTIFTEHEHLKSASFFLTKEEKEICGYVFD